jgi:hypothetical protein
MMSVRYRCSTYAVLVPQSRTVTIGDMSKQELTTLAPDASFPDDGLANDVMEGDCRVGSRP